MQRVVRLAVLLALLAHSIPLSSLALELPVTEEPAAEPDQPQELLPEKPPISETLQDVDIEQVVPIEEVAREETLIETLEEPSPTLEIQSLLSQEESGLLINQSDSSQLIEFSGGHGGAYRYIQPAPIYTAIGSGAVAKLRLYLARNIETTEIPFGGNQLSITLHVPDGSETHICTLFQANQSIVPHPPFTTNYEAIPIGDASAVALIEFENPAGDCVLEAGTSYEVRLINRVNGDGRWTNGILYTRGSNDSHFFLQATATEFPPDEPQICEECASNVLFIPGIKGSRLYIDDGEEEKVWDPIGNEDIQALFLDAEGHSLRSVYTKSGDVLGSVGGFIDIYEGFLQSLGSLANDGVISDWEAVAYDWRLSLEDIVTRGAEHDGRIYYGEATSTPYIEQTLRSLAASSKTGKVTIIAHSNGGLVTKALLSRMGDEETAALIDKIVFVGVPQSGSPQALGALLFGYKEGLPWWFPFIVSPATARVMAENSPMGYHLLPTQNYFDSIAQDSRHPVARFTAQTLYERERIAYGESINTIEELFSYVRADERGRSKPNPEHYWEPNVLNTGLISYAQDTHASLVTWRPPENVALYQIAGWGEDTVSGVEFYEECSSFGCRKHYRPIFVIDGDGVVPIPSSLMLSVSANVERYWVDLREFGFGPIGNIDHGNLLELTGIQQHISGIIEGDVLELPSYIQRTQPTSTIENKRLRFILHSPLTLEVYDSKGNKTGPNQDGVEAEAIPDSQYGRFGEVQYVSVPASDIYRVELLGTGTGTFSIDIQEEDAETIKTTTYANLPATEDTFAHFTISGTEGKASSLIVDVDGDGINDIEVPFISGEVSIYEGDTIDNNDRREDEYNSSPIVETPRLFIEEVKPSVTPPAPLPQDAIMEKQNLSQTSTQTVIDENIQDGEVRGVSIHMTFIDHIRGLYSWLVRLMKSVLESLISFL